MGQGYLIQHAGAAADGTPMAFADQTVQVNSPPLVAVHTASPHQAVTIEAAGDALWLQLAHHGPVVAGEADTAATLSALRPRYHFYAKDGRLMKVDLQPTSGSPQGSLLSTLPTSEICSQSYVSNVRLAIDHVAPHKSYLLLYSPRPASTCFAFAVGGGGLDVQHRAVRLDMDGSTAALAIPEPLVALRDGAGGITGFVVRNGDRLQRTDADFGNAQDLFAAPQGLNSAGVFGTSPPGFWVYRDANDLNIVDLASPGTRTQLGLPQGTAFCHPQAVAMDGASLFMACGRNLLRIAQDGGGAQIGVAAADVTELSLTPTRVVFRAGNELASIPRSGGAVTALGTVPAGAVLFTKPNRLGPLDGSAGMFLQRSFLVGGENVYTAVVGGPSPSRRVDIVNADGTGAVQLAGAAIMNWTEAPQVPWTGHGSTHTVHIVENETGLGFPGAPVTAYDPATRTARFVLGNLADSFIVTPYSAPATPLVFGQPGLLHTIEATASVPLFHRLYLFGGSGGGLTPVAP